jgi:hypothetical protein
VYVPGSPSQKLFRFQNKLINPFLHFFFKKIFLSISPFAQSIANSLNFQLSVESSTKPLPLQDVLLQP